MESILDLIESKQWHTYLTQKVKQNRLEELTDFLNGELSSNKVIYPEQPNWFRALNTNEPEKVKIVILGQDPYHGPGQAQGFSFSVPDGFKVPPSLKNIFKEITPAIPPLLDIAD